MYYVNQYYFNYFVNILLTIDFLQNIQKNMFLGLEKFLAKRTFINVHFPIVLINIEKKHEKLSCD
jgi:hypothetical protein